MPRSAFKKLERSVEGYYERRRGFSPARAKRVAAAVAGQISLVRRAREGKIHLRKGPSLPSLKAFRRNPPRDARGRFRRRR